MGLILALIAALSISTIPLLVGWRRTVTEAQIARSMGVANQKNSFEPEKFAKQTGTGLTWNQILFGSLVWVVGGFIAGAVLSPLVAFLFALAGGFLYWGTLSERRQQFRLNQAKDIMRALGILEMMLSKGGALEELIKMTADGIGPDGRVVMVDLYQRMRANPAGEASKAIEEWSAAWDNPAANVVAACLQASENTKNPVAPMIGTLRITLNSVIEVLSRSRAAAKGVEWQARFLALFPPLVMVIIAIMTPEAGQMYAQSPILLSPILLGSGISYYLSMRMIRDGLSMEASMGMQTGEVGIIRKDRMGNVL